MEKRMTGSRGRGGGIVAGSPTTDSEDEWMLLSARGTTSRPVLLRRRSEEKEEEETDDGVEAGTPAAAVGVGAFRADSEPEQEPSARMMTRNRSSFNEEEFFQSDGYFPVPPPKDGLGDGTGTQPQLPHTPPPMREAIRGTEPSGGRGWSRDGTPAGPRHPEANGSPTTPASGASGSPSRELARAMPPRGLSALESFLFGSDGDVFGLEAIAAAMNAPAVPSDYDFAWGAQNSDKESQVLGGLAAASLQPQIARPHINAGDVAAKSQSPTSQGHSTLDAPEGNHGETSGSQRNLFTAMTLCFTWAVLSTTTQRSSAVTVASTMTVTAIGLGGMWKLLVRRRTNSPANIVSMRVNPTLSRLCTPIVEGVACGADLCGGAQIIDAAEEVLRKTRSAESESGYSSFRRDVVRIPPILRLITTFLALEALLSPSQSLSASVLLRGTSVFVSLFAITQSALQGLHSTDR